MTEPEIRAALGEGDRGRRPTSARSTSRRTFAPRSSRTKLEDASRQRREEGRRGGDGRAARRRHVPHRQVRIDGRRDRQVEGGAVAHPRGLSRRSTCTSQASTPSVPCSSRRRRPARPCSTCSAPSRRAAARCTRRASARSTRRASASRASTKLVVIVVGDEAGEDGAQLARAFDEYGYEVAAIADPRERLERAWNDRPGLRARARRPVQRGADRPVRGPVPGPSCPPRAARGARSWGRASRAAAAAGSRRHPALARTSVLATRSSWRAHPRLRRAPTRSVRWTTRSFSARRKRPSSPTSVVRMSSARTDGCASTRLGLSLGLPSLRDQRAQCSARAIEAVDSPDLGGLPRARGHHVRGWVVSERTRGTCARARPAPARRRSRRRSRLARTRRWHSGDLVFESLDFDGEVEEAARLRLEQLAAARRHEGRRRLAAHSPTAIALALAVARPDRHPARRARSVAGARAHIADDGEAGGTRALRALARSGVAAEEADRARIRAIVEGRPPRASPSRAAPRRP